MAQLIDQDAVRASFISVWTMDESALRDGRQGVQNGSCGQSVGTWDRGSYFADSVFKLDLVCGSGALHEGNHFCAVRNQMPRPTSACDCNSRMHNWTAKHV